MYSSFHLRYHHSTGFPALECWYLFYFFLCWPLFIRHWVLSFFSLFFPVTSHYYFIGNFFIHPTAMASLFVALFPFIHTRQWHKFSFLNESHVAISTSHSTKNHSVLCYLNFTLLKRFSGSKLFTSVTILWSADVSQVISINNYRSKVCELFTFLKLTFQICQ